MSDELFIPVTYNEKEFEFPAQLIRWTYGYRLEIEIEGSKVLFEPDEERNWRALVSGEDLVLIKKFDAELLKAITATLDELFKD